MESYYKCFLQELWRMGVDWIKLAQNMVRWRNTVEYCADGKETLGCTGSSLYPTNVFCHFPPLLHRRLTGQTGSDERHSSKKVAGGSLVQLMGSVYQPGCGCRQFRTEIQKNLLQVTCQGQAYRLRNMAAKRTAF